MECLTPQAGRSESGKAICEQPMTEMNGWWFTVRPAIAARIRLNRYDKAVVKADRNGESTEKLSARIMTVITDYMLVYISNGSPTAVSGEFICVSCAT